MLQPTFQVAIESLDDTHSKLIIEPLEKGYGHTMGVSLRRVLLTSIPGAAVTKVVIDGVTHQFTTLDGMREDIVDFVLNLKTLRFRVENSQPVSVKLDVKGPATVTGKDLDLPAGVSLANPDVQLAVLADKNSKLKATITVSTGLGYSLATEQTVDALGEIPVDASYSPIMRVAYKVEATRVGRRTDYDKLIIELWTDGTITGKEALDQASNILMAHYSQVINPVIVEAPKAEVVLTPAEAETLRLTVEELDLPTRIANALRKGGFPTVKDLVNATRGEVARVKNLGEKSVDVVLTALNQKGVTLKDA